jgi:hypothetical protein
LFDLHLVDARHHVRFFLLVERHNLHLNVNNRFTESRAGYLLRLVALHCSLREVLVIFARQFRFLLAREIKQEGKMASWDKYLLLLVELVNLACGCGLNALLNSALDVRRNLIVNREISEAYSIHLGFASSTIRVSQRVVHVPLAVFQ